MANTTNFNWETPDDTDLVKDGALAIRTLGNSIDTTLVDLKGGTTGQVLSKTSNTDMDFTWVTSDDANAIQNAIVDAKGDLIAASAADTPARLAVGNNGETLVADSSTSTGLRWQGSYEAGKNKIINGDFYINQRGLTSTTSSGSYGHDRWIFNYAGGTVTYSNQAFIAGTAPVAGYEGAQFAQLVTASQSASSSYTLFDQRIEDVRTLAGQTATISFWAKAGSGTPSVAIEFVQSFGSGGSPSADVLTYAGKTAITTSWARYSITVSIPSIAGKTIGTSANTSQLIARFWLSAGSDFNSRSGSIGIQNSTIQLWGVQVEAGSVATAFQTATGTLAGELAACQRYYQRFNDGGGSVQQFALGIAQTTTAAYFVFTPFVPFRTKPTTLDILSIRATDLNTGFTPSGAFSIYSNGTSADRVSLSATTFSGLTQFRTYILESAGSTSAYIGIGAEL